MKKQLVFVGPPASGKGTQTSRLSKELNLPHVDTGSLLRENIKNGTEFGKMAKGYIDKGELVPIDVVVSIIKDRLSQDDAKAGFILDGYPRSIEQAEMLDGILKEINGEKLPLKVLYFDIPIDNLLERIIFRRSCPACSRIFNIKTMPMADTTKCDICGAELVQRADDTEEIAKARFETYFSQTAPLVEFYEKRDELVRIIATGTVDEVYKKLKEVI